jgi:hypothetical protein
MEINRENYEMYFLDYHEGRLTPWQVAELMVFLEANPEFKEEFETFENMLVVPDLSVSFSGKDSLKKNNVPDIGVINDSNYETYFISYAEGLLSSEEKQVLTSFLKIHPELQTDLELYQNSHLLPDLSITFTAKAKLKRSLLNTGRFYYYTLGVAASLALLFGIYLNSGIRIEPRLATIQRTSDKNSATNAKKTQVLSQPGHTNLLSANQNSQIAGNNSTNVTGHKPFEIIETESAELTSVQKIHTIQYAVITSRDIVEPRYIFMRESKNRPATYTNLYDQLNLAEHMKNEPVLAPVASSPKNIFHSGLNKLGSLFTGKESPIDKTTVNFWTLADLGINGYNLLTDKDLRLLTKSNDNGKVVSYALKGDDFEFARNRNK